MWLFSKDSEQLKLHKCKSLYRAHLHILSSVVIWSAGHYSSCIIESLLSSQSQTQYLLKSGVVENLFNWEIAKSEKEIKKTIQAYDVKDWNDWNDWRGRTCRSNNNRVIRKVLPLKSIEFLFEYWNRTISCIVYCFIKCCLKYDTAINYHLSTPPWSQANHKTLQKTTSCRFKQQKHISHINLNHLT